MTDHQVAHEVDEELDRRERPLRRAADKRWHDAVKYAVGILIGAIATLAALNRELGVMHEAIDSGAKALERIDATQSAIATEQRSQAAMMNSFLLRQLGRAK